MAPKSSTFVQETREREGWLTASTEHAGEAEGDGAVDLLSTAALIRGAVNAIPVPEEAEERARAQAMAQFQEQLLTRSRNTEVRAPWYLRLGHFMRFVFTLGRRR